MPLFRLGQLANLLDAELRGDASLEISGIATLQDADSRQIAFFTNPAYIQQLAVTKAAAVLVSAEHVSRSPVAALVMADPYLGYARLSAVFACQSEVSPGFGAGVSVAESAEVAASAQLGANVVIGADSYVGENVYIGSNTVIGARCKIGAGTRLAANVSLYDDVIMGQRCLIHSGAVIGADGFGFAPDNGRWAKIHQLGGVCIGDDVEIGACTSVDSGALADTVIADGVKLDNQIQVGHNVVIGEHTAIAACAALAGSAKIGAHCTIAGGVGIAGHLTIADGSHITAMSLVSKSLPKAGAYSSGTGLMPNRQWKKSVVRFRQLDKLAQRIKNLEDKVDKNKG